VDVFSTGWTSIHKISASITPHGMYFPSTPLPSLPSLLLSEMTWWNGDGTDTETVFTVSSWQHQPPRLKPGFHYPISQAELTARELGCIF